jgi:hypothetical protein
LDTAANHGKVGETVIPGQPIAPVDKVTVTNVDGDVL